MKIHKITTESWKSDGGPVFGVVPKAIWSKIITADENNLINTSNRNLLIEDTNKLVLIDTGMGNKQPEKFYAHKNFIKRENIINEINKLGFDKSQITDVILTHLHYDHVGGAVEIKKNKLIPLFPNAKHWTTKSQWEWALNSNIRESASYFPENFLPLYENGLIYYADNTHCISDNIIIKIYNGHTKGHIVPFIKYNNKTLIYMHDFIPTIGNIPLPYIPAYDIEPLITMQEKNQFLEEAVEKNWILVFQHDFHNECCTVKKTEKGFSADKIFKIKDITT